MKPALWLPFAALAACTFQNTDPMRAQLKDKAYAYDPFFEDGRAMRPPLEDTYPREHGLSADRLPAGGTMDAGFLAEDPLPVTPQVLADGRESFDIYCATCHGLLGDGDSAVARKMAQRPPPALYGPGFDRGKEHRFRQTRAIDHRCPSTPARPCPPGSPLPRPPGYYVTVMTDGYGLMPSYASALTLRQRWEVVAYLEALAISQDQPLAAAPPQERQRLQEARP